MNHQPARGPALNVPSTATDNRLGDPSAKNARRAGAPATHERVQEASILTPHLVDAASTPDEIPSQMAASSREVIRNAVLLVALRKMESGVPTYSVAEAAALLSISQEYLQRVIHAGGFPAVHIRIGARQGRYVVPAKAVDKLLHDAAGSTECVDAVEWTQQWGTSRAGGAA